MAGVKGKSGKYLKTKEHRDNLSKSHLGKKLSEEHRKNLSLSHKGKRKPLSVETKEKIRQSNLGQKSSEETKAKLKISRARQIMKPRSEESRKKMSEDRRGDKWYTYKGGITPLRNQIYNSYKYRQWISDVLLKDNYMCECGKVGGRLCAHHIKSFSTILQENKIKTLEEAFNCSELWNINNGRTLCYECHRKTDNYGGRWAKNKKNNDERTI